MKNTILKLEALKKENPYKKVWNIYKINGVDEWYPYEIGEFIADLKIGEFWKNNPELGWGDNKKAKQYVLQWLKNEFGKDTEIDFAPRYYYTQVQFEIWTKYRFFGTIGFSVGDGRKQLDLYGYTNLRFDNYDEDDEEYFQWLNAKIVSNKKLLKALALIASKELQFKGLTHTPYVETLINRFQGEKGDCSYPVGKILERFKKLRRVPQTA